MNRLNFTSPLLSKLVDYLQFIFLGLTKPARFSMSLIILGILATNTVSVRSLYRRFMEKITSKKMKSFYYLLCEGKISLDQWTRQLIRLAIKSTPKDLSNMPIMIAIDDTLVEKKGKYFQAAAKLFDHSGSRTAEKKNNYINDCFVCLNVQFPVHTADGPKYESIIPALRMWVPKSRTTDDSSESDEKENKPSNPSKLDLAADLLRLVMSEIGKERPAALLCDSWYTKGAITALTEEFPNLAFHGAARHDTAMWKPAPKPEKPTRGRRRTRGERVYINDVVCEPIEGTDYKVGHENVITRLFGNKVISAFVTQKGENGSRRLVLSTNEEVSKTLLEHPEVLPAGDARNFVRANPGLLPLAVYYMRWAIETSFFQLKTFWNFEEYKVRSKEGIERLLNLQAIAYSVLSLLPALDSDFVCLEGQSIQERRWMMEQLISRQIFLESLGGRLQTDEKTKPLARLCWEVMLHDCIAS